MSTRGDSTELNKENIINFKISLFIAIFVNINPDYLDKSKDVVRKRTSTRSNSHLDADTSGNTNKRYKSEKPTNKPGTIPTNSNLSSPLKRLHISEEISSQSQSSNSSNSPSVPLLQQTIENQKETKKVLLQIMQLVVLFLQKISDNNNAFTTIYTETKKLKNKTEKINNFIMSLLGDENSYNKSEMQLYIDQDQEIKKLKERIEELKKSS